jgi:nucleoside-diphosphate-sugar epimerase
MQIFITGASGFIGKNLVPFLLERDCNLTCLVRDPQRLPVDLRSKVNIIIGELNSLGSEVRNTLRSMDAVIHLAGQPWGRTQHDFDTINRAGTLDLIEAIHASGSSLKRFIYMSTLSAGGPASSGTPRNEQTPDEPMSWYGQSKQAGENALAEATFPWTVLRPPTVYGPWDRDVRRFFQLAARHLRPYLMCGHFELSLVHVYDVCQAVWLAISKETRPQSTYYLNDGCPIYQFNEVTDEIMKVFNTWHVTIPIPWGFTWIAERILTLGMKVGLVPPRLTADKLREIRRSSWTCSSDLITARLGYKPEISFQKGIDITMKWYQANQCT